MKEIIKIARQTFWQILGKAITSISTFIILAVVARNYKEEGTGIFTLALTYLTMFNLLVDFGFNAHILKKLKDQDLQQGKEWNKLLGTRLIWSAVLMIFAISLLPLWPFTTEDFLKAVMIGSLALAGFAIYITCNLVFQKKLRYDLSVLSSSIGTLAGLSLYVYLTFQNYPIFLLLIGYSISWIVMALISLALMKNFLSQLVPIFSYQYTKNLFKQSWPIAFTLALNVIYFRADSFMIAYFKGVSDAGVYNIAYSVFQSVLVLPTFIMNSYYPLMLKTLKAVKFVGLALLGLAALATLFVIFLSPEITRLLTGSGFSGSSQSLQILSLGFPAYFLSSLLMWMMVTKGQYMTMLLIYTLGLIFNLILNFIFIPQHSFLAASTISVISEYLILLMQVMVIFLATLKK